MSSSYFSSTQVAESIPFDNESNGLSSTNVQAAIDEVLTTINLNEQVDSNSTGSTAVLTTSERIVTLTNVGLTGILGVTPPTIKNHILVINKTGNNILVSTSLTTPSGLIGAISADASFPNNGVLELIYSTSVERWVIVGMVGDFVDTTTLQFVGGPKTFTANTAFTGEVDFNGPTKPLFWNGLRLFDFLSTFTGVTFSQSATQSIDIDYILPPDNGAVGYVMTNNGSGTLTWEAPSTGGSSGNIDGGTPTSLYGGSTPIDGGTP